MELAILIPSILDQECIQKFVEKTKQEIKESGKEFVPTPLTEEDWQRIGEETAEILSKYRK